MPKIIKIKKKKGIEAEFEVRDIREKFYQVDDTYLNGWAKKCGIYATGVYNVLCRHASRDQSCFPSVKLIADKLSVSPRQVTRAIKALEAYHIIMVERSSGGQNRYWLTDKSQWHETKKWYGYGQCRPALDQERKKIKNHREDL